MHQLSNIYSTKTGLILTVHKISEGNCKYEPKKHAKSYFYRVHLEKRNQTGFQIIQLK
jgi:hypothetical protein